MPAFPSRCGAVVKICLVFTRETCITLTLTSFLVYADLNTQFQRIKRLCQSSVMLPYHKNEEKNSIR